LLEIFVEKSRTIGLGQRLLWHIDKFNKRQSLPKLVNARELLLTPINVRTKQPGQEHHSKKQYLYTEQSNSIFYYNDYRVVLLLDFSQSTTAVYPSMASSYLLKMQKAIEAVLNNLIFVLPN
jgi:hypothetical protein